VTAARPIEWIAFAGARRVARGAPAEVVERTLGRLEAHADAAVLVFDAVTGHPVEVDFRGDLPSVLARLGLTIASAARDGVADDAPDDAPPLVAAPRGPGRPRLGVVAREVTLLPRHWEWLGGQPGGASVALRKLVERAQREQQVEDRRRGGVEAAYRFMHAMAGDAVGFEEAARSLFAHDVKALGERVAEWPADVSEQVMRMSVEALGASSS
jgi:uncharacterized protein